MSSLRPCRSVQSEPSFSSRKVGLATSSTRRRRPPALARGLAVRSLASPIPPRPSRRLWRLPSCRTGRSPCSEPAKPRFASAPGARHRVSRRGYLNNNGTGQANTQDQNAANGGSGGWGCGCGSRGSSSDQSQQASNSNRTEQSASSEATTKQVNVAVPVSVLSSGSGNVKQSNQGSSTASSSNNNGTGQANTQDQNAGCYYA